MPAMTERRRDVPDGATVAAGPLAEADEVRAELARLHAELAALQAEYDANAMARLREANEKLLLASLRAERIADIALRLGHRARARPRARRSGDEPPWQDLRDANAALLVAALDERRHSSAVEDIHQRQVRYLAMVAHELRNPLSPIRSAAALLTRAGDDPAMLHRVQGVIARQVGHMARLVEDLLDGARVASGSFRVEHGSVDLGEVLAQAVETCESAIEQRRQYLALDMPVGLLMIRGDAGRLAQVFGNLLDNASKYTPEGGDIELSVTVADAWVRVRVADSGIGISGSGLERVFDLRQRVRGHAADRGNRSRDRGRRGALSACRCRVSGHGPASRGNAPAMRPRPGPPVSVDSAAADDSGVGSCTCPAFSHAGCRHDSPRMPSLHHAARGGNAAARLPYARHGPAGAAGAAVRGRQADRGRDPR
jgi:signal transduction histidine kinase